MFSDKRNSIMAIATGLISSLINVASSRDMLPTTAAAVLDGSAKDYLCSPLCSIPFSTTA